MLTLKCNSVDTGDKGLGHAKCQSAGYYRYGKQLMKRMIAASGFALLAGCATTQNDLPTQSDLDLDKYAGTWFEQARLPNRFQKDCIGEVRADYTLKPNNRLEVVNQCKARDGSVKTAGGEGRLNPSFAPPDPARLEIRFAPQWTSWIPMVWGDYWIIRVAGDYNHSLVGTPDRKYLWVLSRQRTADAASVQALLDYAATLGFATDDIRRTSSQQ